MTVHNFKKIFFITSFVLFIFSVTSKIANADSWPASCSLNPDLISTTQQTTISFSAPHLPSGTSINLTIESSISPIPAHQETFHLDPGGNYSTQVGPFAEEGTYTVRFSLQYAVPGQELIQCSMFLFVDDSPTGGTSGRNPCVGGICNTALGNISTDPATFIQRILAIAIGLAGGIALILMVIGSIRVLTSSGDQQKLSGGRDMIVAAISGLLFLILSVVILRFIGVNIIGF